ncbi:hypothetical protein [Nocardioides sp. CFH 31398]|uniref:hypothetical protein n=1 Tax=Nocardioides sp. CFH 31398 TaxID=2919579 RepID=UPI001F070DFB|nr:hypothetical protein [Nocardioides sp. CFH 31398]MCH1865058.1 hypothetical protein [Nocardioides sp. CFH 31398]
MSRHPRPGRLRAAATVALAAALTLTAGPVASAEPDPAGPGAAPGGSRWSVTPLGGGAWEVSWTSPRRFPLTSDRPTVTGPDGPVGVPTVEADGRTVVASVRSGGEPDVDELDVVLSGDRLDEPGVDALSEAAPGSAATPAPRRTTQTAVDPAAPGEFDVVTDDYELDPVKLPGMRQPIEMVGHTVEPTADAATGPRPLVLFLHGRHSVCYRPDKPDAYTGQWPCPAPFEEIPSQLGYDYLQRRLASQGYATVSIRVNGINAQDFRLADGGADARAAIVQRHLDHWAEMAAERQVDLDRVVLVGHSRGGEGVDRASIQVPLDAPYRIAGQVLLAPTDFGTQTAPYVPTVTVLPYCDGDVYDLQGQRFTDSSRDLGLGDDTSLKSSVLVQGANHNFFNTEWTPGIAVAPAIDDWFGGGKGNEVCGKSSPTRLSAGEQRKVGVAYVAGAVQLFTGRDEAEVLPLYDGSPVVPPSIGDAEVQSHAVGGGRELRRPALDAGLALAEGAASRFCRGVTAEGSANACGTGRRLSGNAPHWYDGYEYAPPRTAFEMTWDATGQSAGMVLRRPLDLSEDRLELRTIVDPTVGDARIRLRLTDADGASVVVTPQGGGLVPALPLDRYVGKRWAQTVLADASSAPGLDASRITRVDIVARNGRGHVWVLDVAAAPTALAPVPERRAPTVSLGSVRVTEGDGTRPATARVPFTVDGTLTRPARLTVGLESYLQSPEQQSRIRLDLAPGQTEGSIPLTYRPNDLDDEDRRTAYLSAFAVRGAMTDVYDGRVVVEDDDPSPETTTRTPRQVREGRAITATVTLSEPVNYPVYVNVQPTRGRGPQLAVGDLPPAWVKRHVFRPGPPSTPLHTRETDIGNWIRPGRTSVTVTIPTRRDGRDEGVEELTAVVRSQIGADRRTIRVVD